MFDTIFVDPAVSGSERARRILDRIPHSKRIEFSGEVPPGPGLLLTANKGSFLKPCPGQKGNVCCGYWVIEWGLGCPFRCEYCALQTYLPPGFATVFLNLEKCRSEVRELRGRLKGPLRIGTGQFGDSLAMEPAMGIQGELIGMIRAFPETLVELKSKSSNVGFLEKLEPSRNVVVGFSLNPESTVERLEKGASTLEERFSAIRRSVSLGFRCSIHFDPIIPKGDWAKEYGKICDRLGEIVDPDGVAWISTGTFRFPSGFRDHAESNHPKTPIFSEEYYPSSDGKMRIFRPLREEIYHFMRTRLGKILPGVPVYLCMESADVWDRVTGMPTGSSALKSLLDARVEGVGGKKGPAGSAGS